ncbi:acyl-CoA N-acyltransferase [Coprinopsis marcescibilis]|uniref:Acyl-CoA N-acyltransferase n=1 Tax=Coprinopsis marcescibilis TaxID=230819 RepID=A0A5C3L4L9_COPMA|nr:acyl-CoA N-acyltransferase [Coprinopsis marcescibilis]
MAELILFSPDNRVKLVPPSSEHDEDVAILRSDPVSLRYLRFMQPITAAGVAERRETRGKDPRILDFNVLYLDDQTSNWRVVGCTGIFSIDDMQGSCETGILLSSSVHGKGLATSVLYTLLKYVFEERGLYRTTFETAEDNAPMSGWLDRVGARREALRLEAWTDGSGGRTNVLSYAMLAREWREKVKSVLEGRMRLGDDVPHTTQ